MSAQILDGRILAAQLKDDLRKEVEGLRSRTGQTPFIKNVVIGNHASACAYAKSQQRVADAIGMGYELVNLPDTVTQADLLDFVDEMNRDRAVHGIMIHKPVPDHIDYHTIANALSPDKDLEGINVTNIGKMILGQTKIIPCTPASVMAHIGATGIDLKGKEAVIVGHSEIVGKPLALLLLNELATVTVCHLGTSQAGLLAEHVSRADVVVVAVGKAGLVKGAWIKPGAVVIDVGINKVGDQIVGDVEFAAAKERAAFITPVPGGVGPVTVVMLMKNGIETFKQQVDLNL